jgi:hypothetical protein
VRSKRALGAGLDALFPEGGAANTPVTEGVDSKALMAAVNDSKQNPRITVWSPISSAVLRYLRKTTPEFSMSDASSELLEEAIRVKYPELYAQVKHELEG